jgi:small neutral amino acid transporter SnatA (MarC family)
MVVRAMLLPVVFWVVVLALLRLTVALPEACYDTTPDEMRVSAAEAARWITRNQLPDGRYLYEYNRATGTASEDYNIVRHAGVTMSLYQAAGKAGATDVQAGADVGTEWMIDHLVRHDDWAALADEQSAPLGASALMLVSLAERRLLTGDEQYDEVMVELGRFLVAMQREDGGFNAYWNVETQEPDTVTESQFFPGEANWALALLHEAMPDEGFDAAAWAALDYIVLRRDQETDVRMPPRRDHWSAYALGEMGEWGLEEHHIDYARGNAARLASTIRWEAQTESQMGQWFIDWRGGEARGAAFGTWVEGSAALWRLAAVDSRMADLRGDIEERSACGASILVNRQEPVDADPVQAGAWFTEDITRMDDQQHVISGLVYTADALEGNPHREPLPPNVPPGTAMQLVEPEEDRQIVARLLSPLLLLLIVNPLGIALVSSSFGGRTTSLRLNRVWLAAALLIVMLAALLAGLILDWLDISLPNWQLAAGALVAVAVLSLFVQRDPFTPRSADETPDWLAILWGIGWLASPAVVAVVMVTSVDLNRWIALVAAAIAVTAASIGGLLGPALLARLGDRRLRELARWSSLLALIPAALLILAGLNGV